MQLLHRARELASRPWRTRRANLLDDLAGRLDDDAEFTAADLLRSMAAQIRAT